MSIDKTLNAIQTYALASHSPDKAQKAYLKIEYDSEGKPFLKAIKEFGVTDTLQWYLLPKKWNPFDLERVSGICQRTLTSSSKKTEFSLEHLSGIAELNTQIADYNEKVKKTFLSIFYSKIAKVWVPQPLLEKPFYEEHKKNIEGKKSLKTETLFGVSKGVGIYNAGNTCYQNSLIQLCRFSKAFREEFSFLPLSLVFEDIESATKPLNGQGESLQWFRDWIELIGFENATSGTEEDPSELLSYILGSVERPKTFRVLEHNGRSVEQTMLFLQTDTASTQATSVQSLIDASEISFEGKAPKVLPVQLGRYVEDVKEVVTFSFIPPFYRTTKEGFTYKKLHTAITPERHIEIMNKETGRKELYRLVSAVLHKGQSAQSGHYTAVIPEEGDNWIEYNDASVSKIKDASKVTRECSLLMYEKVE